MTSNRQHQDWAFRPLWAFMADESGVTAIEYGLMASLGSLVVIGSLAMTGWQTSRAFTAVSSDLHCVSASVPGAAIPAGCPGSTSGGVMGVITPPTTVFTPS